MKLTRESWHALTIVSHFATVPAGSVLESSELAERLRIPLPFLSKILQHLTRGGVLKGHRGAIRGYALSRLPSQITADEVISSIEGSDFFEQCIFAKQACSNARPCALHDEWASVRPELQQRMQKLTVADLARRKSRKGRR